RIPGAWLARQSWPEQPPGSVREEPGLLHLQQSQPARRGAPDAVPSRDVQYSQSFQSPGSDDDAVRRQRKPDNHGREPRLADRYQLPADSVRFKAVVLINGLQFILHVSQVRQPAWLGTHPTVN